MLTNYFRAAARRLARRPGTTVINLTGLSLACGVALLFGLLAYSLVRYDASYAGADDVYLVAHDIVTSEGTRRVSATWSPLLAELVSRVPDIEAGTRFGWTEAEIETGDERRWLERIHAADPSFFEVFPFPFAEGDPATALAGPDRAVVASDAVERLFGPEARGGIIGRTLRLDRDREVRVMGVVDVPRNVSMQFDVMTSWAYAEAHAAPVRDLAGDWQSATFPTYVRLHRGADAESARLGGLLARVRDGDDEIALVSMRAWTAEKNDFPLYARLFAALALGVLGIAAVNAANLATAQSLDRARSVGVRKTLGAGRLEIGAASLAEAALVAVPAVAVGLVVASAALPWFNRLTEGLLTLHFGLADARLWLALIGLAAFMTVVAGGYPALVLARFRPIDALGGRTRPASRRLRSGLVVAQFALTVFLLAAAVTVHHQVRYLHEIGFDFGDTPVALLSVSAATFDDAEAGAVATRALRDRLRRDPAVAAAALSLEAPGDCCSNTVLRLGETDRALDVQFNYVEPAYFDLYGLEVEPALDPRRALPESGRLVVVNRALAEAAGWPDPVGQTFGTGSGATWTVVGTTPDYAFTPPRAATRAYVHVLSDTLSSGRLSVRAAERASGPLVALLEREWAGMDTRRALGVQFADAQYASAYVPEEALRGLVGYAAGFAVLIALIGLVGLSALLAEQRTKEIGVRKVLGATVAQIVALLTRGPAALVLLSVVLAAPLAVLAMRLWLSQFPYRVEIRPGALALVGALALAATVVVIGLRSVRAATADPVRALRSD